MTVLSSRAFPTIGQLLLMTRPGLTGMVACSAVVSYLVAAGVREWPVALALWLGIFMLSAAASILNQLQEREIDARMTRTRLRPLAAGIMTSGEALLFAAGCAAIGLALLFAINGPTALASLLALLIYNGLYTPVKQYSSLALFPGAISGALPVAAGWLAASGSLLDPRLCSLLIFMVLWQVPHFICLAIPERDDYKYAGLALIPDSVSALQLVYLTRLWTAALAVASLQLAVVGLPGNTTAVYMAVGVIFWLTLRSLVPFNIVSPIVFATAHGGRLKLFLTLFLLLIMLDSVLI